MCKKVVVLIILICVAWWLIPSLCFAEVTVTGVVKSFDSQSGRLVLKTESGAETTVYIPQTVKVYIKTKDEDIEVAEADKLKLLKDNLFRGTRVTIENIEGVVTAIWIVEVPA